MKLALPTPAARFLWKQLTLPLETEVTKAPYPYSEPVAGTSKEDSYHTEYWIIRADTVDTVAAEGYGVLREGFSKPAIAFPVRGSPGKNRIRDFSTDITLMATQSPSALPSQGSQESNVRCGLSPFCTSTWCLLERDCPVMASMSCPVSICETSGRKLILKDRRTLGMCSSSTATQNASRNC